MCLFHTVAKEIVHGDGKGVRNRDDGRQTNAGRTGFDIVTLEEVYYNNLYPYSTGTDYFLENKGDFYDDLYLCGSS